MNTWAKPLLFVSLICYIAVSSIAAVHAFPLLLKTNSDQQTELVVAVSKMEPACHQQATSDTQPTAVSLCEIFCAAMGNIIANKPVFDIPVGTVSAEIAFVARTPHSITASKEPHPPK